jgi:phosphoglycolate phosphatase
MNIALERLGFPPHPVGSYRYFVGDGIECEARRALPQDHRDDETIRKSVAIAREEYANRWAENTRPYPGIPELLSAVEKLGLPKAVLSNKPDDFVQLMAKELLPEWSFQIILGQKPTIARKPDPAGALQIANQLRIAPQDFLYLGDTDTDMQTANSAGMYAVGALWGFRNAEELLSNGAKTLVKIPQEVLNLLSNCNSATT